jgi:transcriptional regulator with XRE-family HTH domain
MTDTVVLRAEAVNIRRVKMGMTRAELARVTGLHANSITRACKGRPVSLRVARCVVAALGLSLRSMIVFDLSRDAAAVPEAVAV